MNSKYLDSIIEKENICKALIRKADLLFQLNEGKHTEQECVLLQRAATIQYELAQMTENEERKAHAMRVSELNGRIKSIYMQINPEKYRKMQ